MLVLHSEVSLELLQERYHVLLYLLVYVQSFIIVDILRIASRTFLLVQHYEQRALHAFVNVDSVILVLLADLVEFLECSGD